MAAAPVDTVVLAKPRAVRSAKGRKGSPHTSSLEPAFFRPLRGRDFLASHRRAGAVAPGAGGRAQGHDHDHSRILNSDFCPAALCSAALWWGGRAGAIHDSNL